ncbi:MAG: undecaprenyl-diphosphatase UppP [Candidatus Curtissbacteria bacterium]
MNYLLAILAGAIQGLTEFLPVSSTGHLIIFEYIFNISQDNFGLAFDASLHLGTLLAVVAFFARDYAKVVNPKNGLAGKLIIGTIPAIAAGLLFESMIESSLRQLWVIGSALILFSAVMVAAEKISKNTNSIEKMNFKDSFIVGLFQALALIPGVSRSGSTISAGLFLNMDRGEAAKFAFMLSGPIVAGAGAKKFLEAATRSSFHGADFNYFLVGIASSAIFGYLTIKYFLKYLSTRNLKPFVIYRIVLGLILIASSLISPNL